MIAVFAILALFISTIAGPGSPVDHSGKSEPVPGPTTIADHSPIGADTAGGAHVATGRCHRSRRGGRRCRRHPRPGIWLQALGGRLPRFGHRRLYSYIALSLEDRAAGSRLPGTSLLYTAGMDVNPDWNNGVTYADAQANGWLLEDSNGNRLTGPGYLADVGNVAYQKAWVKGALSLVKPYPGLDGVIIDNVMVDPRIHYPGMPAKYPTVSAWKAAIASFIAYVGPALRSHRLYVAVNASGFSEDDAGADDGSADAAWARQLAPYVKGVMNEFFEQNPTNLDLRSEGSAWYQHYGSWLGLIDAVQGAGDDFVSLNYSTRKDRHVARYCKASFLLGWNGKGGGQSYLPNDGSDPWGASWTADIGRPRGRRFKIGALWVRRFTRGKVIVNPTLTSRTVTVDGARRRIGATDALIQAR